MEDGLVDNHNLPQLGWIAWLYRCLGAKYSLAIPFLAVLALILVALSIWKFKTPALTVVLVAVVPLPLIYGAMSFFDGLLQSLRVMVLTSSSIHPTEVADATVAALVGIQVGAILTVPIYLVAVTALVVRALRHSETFPDQKAEPPIGAQMVR